MTKTKHKLNESKAEFIFFGTKIQVSKVLQHSIHVGGDRIEGKQVVRNLGSMFDSELKMVHHVSHIRIVGYFHLRQLRLIRSYACSGQDITTRERRFNAGLRKRPSFWDRRHSA